MAQITTVTLRRGPCFGTCPVYEVTLRCRGRSTWIGEMFAERVGRYRGDLDADEFGLLADFIERSGFFEWSGEYNPPFTVTDGATDMLEVRRARSAKTVSQYSTDEPPNFWVIATLVDALAGRISWTRIKASGIATAEG